MYEDGHLAASIARGRQVTSMDGAQLRLSAKPPCSPTELASALRSSPQLSKLPIPRTNLEHYTTNIVTHTQE